MTGSLFRAFRLGDIEDAGPEEPQDVSYSYWPCNYLNGDPTIITNAPIPLSGVQFSVVARGVGEMQCTLQLADDEIRSRNPWELFVQRKTGIVVVRTVRNRDTGGLDHTPVFHGILWSQPTDPATGRMALTFQTVESLWAHRKITGPPPMGFRDGNGNILPGMNWSQVDQAQIARDLLDPSKFSQVGALPGQFPGWINVEGPSGNTGVLRDMSYPRNSETPLLTAHQDRSKVINGYEWFTTQRVLTGNDAYNAGSFRVQFVMGYPRLGRAYSSGAEIPQFTYHVDGRGNVAKIAYAANGIDVANVVWGTGSGFDDDALRVFARYPADWSNGFFVTEDTYSNSDVSIASTLQDQTNSKLIQSFTNERYVASVTLRGDLYPYFGSYAIGDDCLFTSDDWTLQDQPDGSRELTYVSRIMGWRVTPPEGENNETVDVMLAGQESV